jgi:spermidine/putrescine transport system substrate-binding protein
MVVFDERVGLMKQLLRSMALMVFVMVLMACGSAPAPAAVPTAPAAPEATAAPVAATEAPAATSGSTGNAVDKSKLSAKLHVYNWTDYIDPALLTAFEKEYGVKVIVDNYDQNEDMIAKVRAGGSGYDIVVPPIMPSISCGGQGCSKSSTNRYCPISCITSLPYSTNTSMKADKYSVPYMSGITGIALRQKNLPDSCPIAGQPCLIWRMPRSTKGSFSMLDDEREVPGAALRYLGFSFE